MTTFGLTRQEGRHVVDPAKTRAATEAELAELAPYLGANANVAITPEMRQIAASVVGAEKNPVVQARKLYDWTLDNVTYWVEHDEPVVALGGARELVIYYADRPVPRVNERTLAEHPGAWVVATRSSLEKGLLSGQVVLEEQHVTGRDPMVLTQPVARQVPRVSSDAGPPNSHQPGSRGSGS